MTRGAASPPADPSVRNVRVRLAYDGARFFGWQRQEGFPSVQGALEDALCALCATKIRVNGAGRTDTGVHALGQVANFHVSTRLPDERLIRALNAHLPPGVVVRDLETCAGAFHAQKDARGKRYAYRIRSEPFPLPFAREGWLWRPRPLDLCAMRAALPHLVGRHDFSALAGAGSPRKSNVRTIRSLHILARRDALAVVVEGDGFLYNMVRTLVGTLLEVGEGKRAPGSLPALLRARDRTAAGPTAPAGGLYLVRVLYDEPCFVPRRPSGGSGRARWGR
jgi:tRNA pseudouridine38-40 synthase